MNNLCNSSSSSWRELHRQSQVYWLILVVHFAVQCWDACCVWGVRSVLPVQCRGRLPETHVWKPFWHSSASWCDQHWPWPIFIIPILFFFSRHCFSVHTSVLLGLCFIFAQFSRHGEMADWECEGCSRWPPFTPPQSAFRCTDNSARSELDVQFN